MSPGIEPAPLPSSGRLPLTSRAPGEVLFRRAAGEPVTVARFLRDVAVTAERLPDRRYALNLCSDRYHFLVAFGVLLVGMITGIDGSGFAGLPLTGTLSGALGPVVGVDPATLAAVGQMGAVWTGGGTLIAWSSLIAVAGFARVNVLSLVRALLLPVLLALFVSTICAVLIWS